MSTANAQVLINQIGLIGQQPNISCVYSLVTFRPAQNNYHSYYRMFLLTPNRARGHFCRTESVHPTVYPVITTALRIAIKETYFVGKQHGKVCSIPDIKYSYLTGPLFLYDPKQRDKIPFTINVAVNNAID